MAEGVKLNDVARPVPELSGDRDVLPMAERERSLLEAIQWVREELSSLKSQDQSLMRKFLALRSEINNLKDELPMSFSRSSSIAGYPSPKNTGDEDVFFQEDTRRRMYSDTSFRDKSYSSGSEDEKF